MNKKLVVYLSFLLILLSSCQITERIYINKNGSVKFEKEFLTQNPANGFNVERDSDLTKQNKFPVDTIVPFADLNNFNKNSKLDLQQGLVSKKDTEKIKELNKLLKNAKAHIIFNKNEISTTLIINKKNIKSLNKLFVQLDKFNKKYEMKDTSIENKNKPNLFGTSIQIKFNGNNFQRISLKQLPKIQNDTLRNAMNKAIDATYNFIQYKFEYHFPKPIKKTSLKGATFSADMKTLYFSTEMSKIVENPKKYNFTVTLK